VSAPALSTRFADSLARAYDRTPPRLRARALRGPQRRFVLASIFAAMERSLDRERAAGIDTVVHWEIACERDGADRWQVAIAGGRCVASRRLDREPALTIKLDGPTFLELVSGRTPAPALYMAGRLKVDGDPMQAARLTTLFRVPKRAR
jgi:putative sterol carrier protein